MNPTMSSGAAPVAATRPTHQTKELLHFGFTIAPIVAGLDKYFNKQTNKNMYLAPIVPRLLHVAPHMFMQIVGVVEIFAGFFVVFLSWFGDYIVGCWLLV